MKIKTKTAGGRIEPKLSLFQQSTPSLPSAPLSARFSTPNQKEIL